jgi:hypothetical protein
MMMREHAVIDQNAIRRRAYERWQQRGCPAGTAHRDWLDAEQELLGEQTARAVPSPLAAQLPAQVTTGNPAVPRPRRPRSLITTTSTAPAAQLLAALVANGRR